MPFKPIADPAGFGSSVVLGKTPETRVLEFKAEYRWRKNKDNPEDTINQAEELSRDVAQFANSDGGTLLVGVGERKTTDGRIVADAIDPVENVDGLIQWVEQALRKYLTPSTFSRSLDTIVLPDGPVLAINVQPCLHLVALWHPERKNGLEFLYRTDHGKQWMNPDEVEKHIMNGSRAMQIQLDRVLDEVSDARNELPVDLTPPLKSRSARVVSVSLAGEGPAPKGPLVTVEGDVFVFRASSSDREIELSISLGGRLIRFRLPHGLIREAWRTSDNRVGLCLNVAIVVRGDRDIWLEPLESLG